MDLSHELPIPTAPFIYINLFLIKTLGFECPPLPS